jgi:hypothetical protein
MSKNHLSDWLIHIGDRVVMDMDSEARSWGRKGVPDGTQGTVVGFHRWTEYIGRVDGSERRIGRYINNSGSLIAWDNGVNDEFPTSSYDLAFVENHEKLYEERWKDKSYQEAFRHRSWVGELPELPIWEWDIVAPTKTLLDRDSEIVQHYGPYFFVRRIDYNQIGEKRSDGVTPMPIYQCSPVGHTGPTFALDETEVKLHERGNVWKWMNNRPTLKFENLQEEISLHSALGLRKQIQNPTLGHYGWTLKQVLLAISNGDVDAFTVCNAFDAFLGIRESVTPDSDRHYAYKFEDEDLGRRVREKTMEGFHDLVAKYVEQRKKESATQ